MCAQSGDVTESLPYHGDMSVFQLALELDLHWATIRRGLSCIGIMIRRAFLVHVLFGHGREGKCERDLEKRLLCMLAFYSGALVLAGADCGGSKVDAVPDRCQGGRCGSAHKGFLSRVIRRPHDTVSPDWL